MKNKINFVTGETYTLAELFSGNRRIIIPDLQRDYCWGDQTHTAEKKELVSGFVETLMHQYNPLPCSRGNAIDLLNLGLIYGYEAPEGHIQLCDGQQRITTLFLLLGMLNKKSEQNVFRRLLISDYEYLQDDREPYLQYAIRESSLYFLSDLVCHFFIKEEEDHWYVEACSDIKKSSWFFSEYHSDPSICSMIRALETMDYMLREKNKTWCEAFGLFISSRLTFMYYDMEDRKNGEETFVVINTTGEPLSANQNLKPLIISKNSTYMPLGVNENELQVSHKVATDWEEMENWFWKKRGNDNDTADAGFNEFLRWITMLHAEKEELKLILANGKYTFPVSFPFEDIYSYWQIVKFLFESWDQHSVLKTDYLSPSVNKECKETKTIGQIDCFQLLPLIAYCKTWGIPKTGDRVLLRLYQFVHNLARIDNVRKAVNELVYDAILIAKSCKDIIEVLEDKISVSTTILSKEEKLKLEIVKSNLEIRDDIEDSFWQAQNCEIESHNIWSGQILPLIEWSTESGNFSLDKFNKYLEIFDKTFSGKCDEKIDDVRRALLTRNLKEYPKIIKGYTNFSFGWEWNDWSILINENKDAFKKFFDDLHKGCTVQDMIKNYGQSEKWSEFVHKDYLLEYCQKKNIQWDDNLGWLLIKQQRATNYFSVKNYHLKKYLESNLQKGNWEIRIWHENLLVVENEKESIVLDIRYVSEKWEFEFFRRTSDSDTEYTLGQYVDDTWKFNTEKKRYTKSIDFEAINGYEYEYPNAKDLVQEIINRFC